MSIQKTYAVLGMGRYGIAVAQELVKSGAEVLAVDDDMNVISSLINVLMLRMRMPLNSLGWQMWILQLLLCQTVLRLRLWRLLYARKRE